MFQGGDGENIKGEHFRGTLKLMKGGGVGWGPEVSPRGADHVELPVTTTGFVRLSSAPETPREPPLVFISYHSSVTRQVKWQEERLPTRVWDCDRCCSDPWSHLRCRVLGCQGRLQLPTAKTSPGRVSGGSTGQGGWAVSAWPGVLELDI